MKAELTSYIVCACRRFRSFVILKKGLPVRSWSHRQISGKTLPTHIGAYSRRVLLSRLPCVLRCSCAFVLGRTERTHFAVHPHISASFVFLRRKKDPYYFGSPCLNLRRGGPHPSSQRRFLPPLLAPPALLQHPSGGDEHPHPQRLLEPPFVRLSHQETPDRLLNQQDGAQAAQLEGAGLALPPSATPEPGGRKREIVLSRHFL